ncbi:hypothetical protein KO481_31345 [Nocardia sp. NEAU-G5]|uniref:Spondin domain-containing protein n=1 Tax=Nocardia albiluteola TaxID=2842303 RepID=A0ABS6B8B1_9NOCA|nr:hypothetical protein [Nocardia albiluteola]MBU3066000.1 hypothetical protein [Nocardia albiluteola]
MAETPRWSVVQIVLRACPKHLTLVQAIGLTIAPHDGCADSGHTWLRTAIGEVVTLSILDATPCSAVYCELSREPKEITVQVRSTAENDLRFSPHQLSWHMLRSLLPPAAISQGPFDERAGGYPTVIGFTWKREDLE